MNEDANSQDSEPAGNSADEFWIERAEEPAEVFASEISVDANGFDSEDPARMEAHG